jgi:hypothetical protein
MRILPGLMALTICFLGFGNAAMAGAWTRAKGENFQTIALRHDLPEGRAGGFTRLNIYHETGVRDRLTLAFDMSHSLSGEQRAMAFFIHKLPLGGKTFASSWSLGLGLVGDAPAGRLGLALGYGFQRGEWTYWASGEGAVEALRDNGGLAMKLDATIGAELPKGQKIYAQAFSGYSRRNGAELRLGAAAAIPVKKGLYLDVGASRELISDRRTRIKLGVWRSF